MGKTAEELKQYKHEWYEKNKNRILAMEKENRKNKKEQLYNYEKKRRTLPHRIEAKKKWTESNREYKKEYDRQYKKEKREYIKNRDYNNRYNLSIYGRRELIIRQNNKCAICGVDFKNEKLICTDHDHKTNKVRMLLCMNCNFLLGHSKDNINILKNAIIYLKIFEENDNEN